MIRVRTKTSPAIHKVVHRGLLWADRRNTQRQMKWQTRLLCRKINKSYRSS